MNEENKWAQSGQNLTVTFEPIDQVKSQQYVEWEWSDNDSVAGSIPDDPDTWVLLVDDEGNPIRGNVLENVQEPGDYRAVIHNYITENNKAETRTDIIQVYKG